MSCQKNVFFLSFDGRLTQIDVTLSCFLDERVVPAPLKLCTWRWRYIIWNIIISIVIKIILLLSIPTAYTYIHTYTVHLYQAAKPLKHRTNIENCQ